MRPAGRLFGLLTMVLVLLPLTTLTRMVNAEELIVYTALEDDEYPGYLELFKKAHPDITVKVGGA